MLIVYEELKTQLWSEKFMLMSSAYHRSLFVLEVSVSLLLGEYIDGGGEENNYNETTINAESPFLAVSSSLLFNRGCLKTCP